MVQRLRRIDLHHMRTDRAGLGRPIIRSDGSMIVQGYIAREGVMEYGQPDGSVRREFVSASTLRGTMDGLVGLPVTCEHPTDTFGRPTWVTPDNYDKYAVGTVLAVEWDEEARAIKADMSVMRRDMLNAVNEGKIELSPGYDADVQPANGHHDGGTYSAQQTWRGYNHVAFVDNARGGATVRARVDSAGNYIGAPHLDNDTEDTMPTNTPSLNPHLLALAAFVGVTEAFNSDNEAIASIRRTVDGMKSAAATNATELAELRESKIDAAEHARLKTEHADLTAKVEALENARKLDSLQPMARAYGVDIPQDAKPDDVFATIAGKITGERIDSKTADMSEIRGLVRGHYAAKFGSGTGGGTSNEPAPRNDNADPWGQPRQPVQSTPNADPWGQPARTDAAHSGGRRTSEAAWNDASQGAERRADAAPDSMFRPGPSAAFESHINAVRNPQR